MKIENLAVEVRPRDSWEAGDLGLVMVREWWRQIYPPYLFLLITFAVPLFFILRDTPILAAFILWWMKPVFSRMPLVVLAEQMFGSKVTFQSSLVSFKKVWMRGLFGHITLFRVSPLRCALLPVYALEGVVGSVRSKRLSQLRPHLSGEAFTATTVFLLFEWFAIFTGLVVGVTLFVPDEFSNLGMDDFGLGAQWMYAVFYVITLCILEPIYVAVCFGLYLNSRTILEGWDIELKFRSMARRLVQKSSSLVVLLGFLLLASSGLPLRAQDDGKHEDRIKSERVVKEVFEDPRYYKPSETQEGWRARPWLESSEPSAPRQPLNFGGALGNLFGYLIYGFLIIALIALIVVIIRLLPKNVPIGEVDLKSSDYVELESGVSQLLGPEPLPEDILTNARLAWQAGEHRKALSYLYRGSLRALHEGDRLSIDGCATEEEVLRRVKTTEDTELASFFESLTRKWQWVAYAHRDIDDAQFFELLDQWKDQLEGQS